MSTPPHPAPDPGLIMEIAVHVPEHAGIQGSHRSGPVHRDRQRRHARAGNRRAPEVCRTRRPHPLRFSDHSRFSGEIGRSYAVSPTVAPFLDARSPAYIGAMANFLATSHNYAVVRRRGTRSAKVGRVWVTRVDPEFHLGGVRTAHVRIHGHGGRSTGCCRGAARRVAKGARYFRGARHVWHRRGQSQHEGGDLRSGLEERPDRRSRKCKQGRKWENCFHEIPGSAFDVEFGREYDLVLIPNFLHHFDWNTCVGLLKRVKAALKPTGIVATSEFVPNADRVTPPMPAAFSLQMLVGTPAGDAYTFAELNGMFREAGFPQSSSQPLGHTPQTLILTPAS